MTAAISDRQIPGFVGEIEQFVTEHGITDAVFNIYEVTCRHFHLSSRIRVELYVDHEDSSWVSLYFVIEDWPLDWEHTKDIDQAWSRETHPLIPFDWHWRLGHRIEWRE